MNTTKRSEFKMKRERTIKTSKPVICTGIIRMPNKKAMDSIKQLLGA